MKNLNLKRTILSLLVLSAALIFTPNFSHAANTEVNNQDSLVSAIENAKVGDVIELTEDIVLIKPVGITEKNITIDGKGHSISRIDTNWTPNGSDGSLITAGSTGTKVTLKNLTLKDAQKYGVQSYNGAYVILDNVTLTNNGYGAVLVNAGTVEVRNLILKKNGQYGNNGIEIGKGDATGDKTPTLVMNGTISSTEKNNVIYIAENDNLSEFEVKNTESSPNKIFVEGNKVVVADKDNNILYESNEYAGLEIVGDEYEEKADTPEEPAPAPKPESQIKDKTPKTGTENILQISTLIFIISSLSLIALKRKDF